VGAGAEGLAAGEPSPLPDAVLAAEMAALRTLAARSRAMVQAAAPVRSCKSVGFAQVSSCIKKRMKTMTGKRAY
jgi:hypothetical protein